MNDNTRLFEKERPRLVSLCYRMLGERSSAEDAVQDTYLRWAQTDVTTLANPQAWLTRTATNIAIDMLRSARERRETYVGPWLPEPLIATENHPVEQDFILAQDCSLALLWAMERLQPTERAALILRDAFDADYSDLAEVLGKSEAACRQLVSRARKRVRHAAPRFTASEAQVNDLISRFFAAVAAQDHEQVKGLFAAESVAISDGGADRRAARRVLTGPQDITQVSLALMTKYSSAGLSILPCKANGQPALLRLVDGQPDTLLTLLPDHSGRIAWLYTMRAPAKLALRQRGGTNQTSR